MIEQKLAELGLELPEVAKPSFLYVPVVVHEHVAYVSGQLPKVNGDVQTTGKVGAEVGMDDAREAARICVLQALAALREALGSLDRVERILRMNGYVASATGFSQQPTVIDAASELLVRVFGEAGQHARAAVGVAELPRNSPVEIEFTVAVRP